MKDESEKIGLKLSIQKTKIMASCPITSWEIDGETVETVGLFILGGLQNHCRLCHEIKRHLLFGRKVMANLEEPGGLLSMGSQSRTRLKQLSSSSR